MFDGWRQEVYYPYHTELVWVHYWQKKHCNVIKKEERIRFNESQKLFSCDTFFFKKLTWFQAIWKVKLLDMKNIETLIYVFFHPYNQIKY